MPKLEGYHKPLGGFDYLKEDKKNEKKKQSEPVFKIGRGAYGGVFGEAGGDDKEDFGVYGGHAGTKYYIW